MSALASRSRSVTTKAPWGEVAWRIWGDPGNPRPRVVLLNGGSGSWLHWIRTIPAMESHYLLLVPDLPGMGRSSAPPEIEPVEALVEAMAQAIDAGLDELVGSGPVHIVGFSFGAMVGTFAAQWRASQVASFVMIGASGLGLGFRGPSGLGNFSAGLDEVAKREIHRVNLGAIMFGDPSAVDELALEMQLLNAATVRVRTHTAASTRVMREPLSKIVAPMHAFWGSRDPYLPTDEQALEALFDATR